MVILSDLGDFGAIWISVSVYVFGVVMVILTFSFPLMLAPFRVEITPNSTFLVTF